MITSNDPKEGNLPKTEIENPVESDNDPINEPNQVQESNDESIDKDFPGYPHYPAKDDILNPENNLNRVDVVVENISRTGNIPGDDLERTDNLDLTGDIAEEEEESTEKDINTQVSPSDVTEEDLLILGDKDQDMDDEENEYYSIGGDEKSNIDENKE